MFNEGIKVPSDLVEQAALLLLWPVWRSLGASRAAGAAAGAQLQELQWKQSCRELQERQSCRAAAGAELQGAAVEVETELQGAAGAAAEAELQSSRAPLVSLHNVLKIFLFCPQAAAEEQTLRSLLFIVLWFVE